MQACRHIRDRGRAAQTWAHEVYRWQRGARLRCAPAHREAAKSGSSAVSAWSSGRVRVSRSRPADCQGTPRACSALATRAGHGRRGQSLPTGSRAPTRRLASRRTPPRSARAAYRGVSDASGRAARAFEAAGPRGETGGCFQGGGDQRSPRMLGLRGHACRGRKEIASGANRDFRDRDELLKQRGDGDRC